MLALLNPYAGGGDALRRWKRVEPHLVERHGRVRVVHLDRSVKPLAQVLAAAADGETDFVAAGGDGTVNLVATAVLESGFAPGLLRLGAIGLGSSNDFHKPCRESLAGIPVRIDFDRAGPVDVARLAMKNIRPRYVLITASAGVTADANDCFNRTGGLRLGLKVAFPGLAVIEAAVRTIARARPRPLRLDRGDWQQITNVAFLLTPYCAGSLSYGEELRPPAGQATMAICGEMGRAGLFSVLANLATGRFRPGTERRSWQAPDLEIESEMPVAIEYDGEIVYTSHACLAVLPGGLFCCP